MKKIEIEKVDNGYLIKVVQEGNQSIYELNSAYVAKNVEEVVEIIKDYII